ncbi:MAG: hypothetical protein KC613_21460, partial [Myxococcales bacterium]|nr:hypothetical protein [Myxococcales bacterium]
MSSSDAPRFADLLSRSALEAAWDHVSTGSEAAGIDRVTPAQFAEGAAARLDALHAALHGGGYKPMPARRIVLPDDPARPIAVSTVVDRVVQRALAVGLSPFYEARFTDDAWAYRPGRGVTAALEVVERHLANGRCWIGRTDISKFFDRIDRARLLAELADDGLDEPTVRLVDRLLRAGTVAGCARHDPGLGTPQGSALSPLLSNVYLRPVDRVMAARGVPYLRYADDILVLAETEPGLGDAFEILVQAVEARGLQLNARKTSRGHLGGGFVFLGARFDATGRWLAKGAVEALAARAVEVLDKPVRQVELIEEWRRWYGPVAPAVDVPLPVLAAAVQAAAKRDDEATLVAWARARPAAEGRLPVADHIRLVERWMAVDHPAADRAAVVDAQRVAEAARVERTWDRLARALGVTGEVARALGAGE